MLICLEYTYCLPIQYIYTKLYLMHIFTCIVSYILVGALKQQRRLAANREHPYQRATVGVPAKPAGFIEIQ